jgi:dTDP-4-dehydrorhamnose reductase
LARGQSIDIVTDQFRTPTWSVDLADGIERLVRFGKHGIFHLSGRELMSVHDAALNIADVFGYDPDLVRPTDGSRFTQTAPRPARSGFIILKAESELGYRPTPFRDALEIVRSEIQLAETPR